MKLFPATTVALGHLRPFLRPFPDLQIVPTYGVAPETANAPLDTEALAMSPGSELVRRAQASEPIAEEAAALPRCRGYARVHATHAHSTERGGM